MRASSKPSNPTIRASQLPRFAWLIGLSMAVGTAWLGGCSSSSDDKKSPCDGVYKGKCGIGCKLDTDCAAGVYCSAAGVCTADCSSNGEACAGGTCDTKGHCQTGGTIFGVGGGPGSLTGDAQCVADQRRGEGLPSDLYIMNDQSQSMSCAIPTGGDRWTAMTTAITSFVNSPEAQGLGVGIQYFGILNPNGQGAARTQGTCNVADYSIADVEIAPLPGNAQAIVGSLGRHGPSTYTPTPVAIQGAIAHAQAWQHAHPDRQTAVVLATDGQPNLCGMAANNDGPALIGEVAGYAAGALAANPPLRTYVIGIVGGSAATGGQGCNLDPAPPNKPDLDRVAQAGGTTQAFIVDAATGDTSAQFLAALNTIRGAATIPCQYVMPASTPSRQVDPNQVNIQFTPVGGTAKELLQAPDPSTCDPANGGWYYDNPATPTKILLCPATCDLVKADARTAVDIYIGCRPTQKITR